MDEERPHWTHEIATIIKISDSTLRKWCICLEKNGYVFVKGQNNSRAFLVRDKNALLYSKKFRNATTNCGNKREEMVSILEEKMNNKTQL